MADFSVDDFMEGLYADTACMAKEPLSAVGCWEAYRCQQKLKIRELLKLPRLEAFYRKELSWELEESLQLAEEALGQFVLEKYRVDAIRNLSLAVYVLKAVERPKRAILFLNGHDPRGAAGVWQPCKGKSLGLSLAKLGYLVIIPELFGMGEAKAKADADKDACGSCEQLGPRLLNCGLNLVGLRVWEAFIALDFARQAYGLHHFAAYGISGGGHVCNYAGVLDDRIDTIILSGYPNLYRYSTMALRHCICNYIPGQIELGESYYVTALAAPDKRLVVMNGKEDPIFPLEGSNYVFPRLRELYRALGAEERYTDILFDGGHEVNVEAVCGCLKKQGQAG